MLPIELPTEPRRWGPLVLRTLLLNQIIAIPVALAMTSVSGNFFRFLGLASLYSHLIGACCLTASLLTIRRMDRMRPGAQLAAVAAVYFFAGIIGAEIARRISLVVFPWSVQGGGIIASAAVGSTVALVVGIILVTLRRLRAQVMATELDALQARINPHFLFNTLNSIAALIREDPARAEAVTLQLSSLFRYTLQAPKQGLVTLEEELAIVEGYLAIEQQRLAERLTYSIDVEPSLLGIRVPPLLLQPLAENAIKHGVATAVGGGRVTVVGRRQGDRIDLTVTDTRSAGDAVSGGAPGTGEGFENVRRRLRGTFGPRADLVLARAGDATEARVTFHVQAGEAR
jgi:two-component system sensor histidine kinase AlgZ